MTISITMPALSPTMTEGKLAKWLVSEGDQVTSGDVIAEIETDKAVMEVEALDDGILHKISIAEGTEGVAVGVVIAEIRSEEEDVDASASFLEIENLNSEQPEMKAEQTAYMPEGASLPQSAMTQQVQNVETTQFKKLSNISVREALRDAMAEEMRRDDKVFVMGEEVGEYHGAYKVTQGLLDECGARRVVDTPITEMRFAGLGVGAAFGQFRPIVEFMTFHFAIQAIH